MSGPNFQSFFPCLPDYMSWEDWNGNLLIYYGQRNIEVASADNWREGAMNIVQSPVFGRYPVPTPDTYQNWQDWAYEFTNIINGPTN